MSFDEQPDDDPHGECAFAIHSLRDQLAAKSEQVDRLRTAMDRVLRLAADPVIRPWTMRRTVAGIAAGAIAATALDDEASETES